jgi:hypothetical protein
LQFRRIGSYAFEHLAEFERTTLLNALPGVRRAMGSIRP